MKKIQQLLLYPHPLKLDYLDSLMKRFRHAGYDAVMIEYCHSFPYRKAAGYAVAGNAYSLPEIAEIDRMARENHLEVLPKGISFSHLGRLRSCGKYTHLIDGDGLDLTSHEAVSLLSESVLELADAHPQSRIIHIGGDEIFHFGKNAAAGALIQKKGISWWYVNYLNRVFAEVRMKRPELRLAVWSDMLIKYPESISALDPAMVIFYWDYWGFGEDDCPILSTGGGCPDLFVLDRDRLPRDLAKILRCRSVRDGAELVSEHTEIFGEVRRLRLDGQSAKARSFPYLEWFRKFNFDVVSCALPYPEKSSIMGNYAEKIDHLRSFSRRSKEYGALAMMSCLWQPWWPLFEAVMPALMSAPVLFEDSELEDLAFYSRAALRLGDGWTPEMLKQCFMFANAFELNDLLTVNWERKTPKTYWRIEENCKEEYARAKQVAEAPQVNCPGEALRFFIDDVRLRAEMQLALLDSGKIPVELVDQWRMKKHHFLCLAFNWYCEETAKKVTAERYPDILEHKKLEP